MTFSPEVPPAEQETVAAEAMIEEAPSLNSIRQWDLSAHYGMKYVSYNQKKSLGKSDVNTVFLNYLQFNAEYAKNEWSTWGHINTYRVKYVSGNLSDSRQISTYELGGSYKSYLATLSLDELPLFKETTGPVEMSKMSLLNIGIGLRHQWQLEKSLLAFKSSLKYPLSSSSSQSKVKISDPKGFKAKGQLQWQYPFYKTTSYELFADWQNDLSYQQLEQKVTWGNSSGKNQTSIIEATSSIGIHLKY
jgi:hypothetical protein